MEAPVPSPEWDSEDHHHHQLSGQHAPTEASLKPHFGIWSSLSVGLNTLNLFGGISFIITTAFSAGGIPAVFYGYLGASVGAICITVVFIECASLYPTAGGSYHFASFLTPLPHRRWVSYMIGWFNYIGWVLTFAACCAICSSLIFGIVNLLDDSFDVFIRWRLFLGYIACATAAWAINTFAIQWTPFCALVGGWAGTFGFVTYTIALLAVSPKQSVEFVFQDIVNETGYPSNSMAVLIGLFSATTVWQCLDAPTHIAEEIAEPTKVVPRVLILNVSIQWFIGAIWILTVGFCMVNPDIVINTQTGVPILELVRQATDSQAAAVVFGFIQLTVYFASTVACATTTSRQGLAFARDGGFPYYGDSLSYVSAHGGVPFWSLTLAYILSLLVGLVYLFSPQGFNAILGAECAFLLLSFGSPALLMLVTRRSEMAHCKGRWALGSKGYAIAIVASVYSVFVSVIVMIPQQHPLTAPNMNYTVLICAIFSVIILAGWFLKGRRQFVPPSLELIAGVDVAGAATDIELTKSQREEIGGKKE